MQDLNLKIKEWFKKAGVKQPSYEKKSLKPQKDWTILITVSTAIVLSCGVWAYFFFIAVDSGQKFKSDNETFQAEVKINNALLEKTVSEINERKENFDRLNLRIDIPKDPSR